MAEDSVGQIGLDLVVNQNQFNQQMRGITGLAKKAGLALAGAFAVKKLVAFGNEAIKLGSDLNEVQNVVDVTFPKMSKQVDAFAKNAASQFGLSETMAKRFTGTFGAMAKAFGFSESAAYDMGSTLTGLAGDVASFYNLSQEEAYTKLKSVFTGETESLKDLGVVMTQTALDAYAMANGYGKATSAMSEAEKVALRYAFVQDQLALATGDFSRTSGSWANQVRLLNLQFDSLKATIGQGLINVFTPVIRVMNVLLGKLATVANAFKAFTELITGNKSSTGNGIADATSGLEDAAGAASDLTDNTTAAGKAAKQAAKDMKQMSGIDKLNNMTTSEGSSGSSGGSSSVGATVDYGAITDEAKGGAVEKLSKNFDKLRDSLAMLWDEGLSKLKDFTFGALEDFYKDFLVPIGKWTVGQGLPNLIKVLNKFLNKIAWDDIRTSLDRFWMALEPFAEGVGNGLIRFFGDLLEIGAEFINVTVPSSLNAISSAFEHFSKKDAEDFGYSLGQIATALAVFKGSEQTVTILTDLVTAINSFKGINLANLIYFNLGGAGTPAFDVFANEIIDYLSDALKELIPDWAYDFVSTLGGGIILAVAGGALAGPVGFIGGALAGLLGGLDLTGAIDVDKIFNSIFNWDVTKSLFSDMKERFQDALNATDIGEIGINIVEGLADGILGALTFLVEPMADLCDTLVSGVKKLLGIHSPSTVFAEIGGYIVSGFKKGIKDKWSNLTSFFTGAWGNIKNTFNNVPEWFETKFYNAWKKVKNVFSGITTFISGIFTVDWKKAWEGIKNIFSTVFRSLVSIAKAPINLIIGLINGMISGISNAVNGIVNAVNKLSFDVPEWVPKIGGKKFGFNLKTVSIGKIPYLAQGGYVKANTPQLAMIGDNRHQGEVVAPEDKLQELLDKAVSASKGADVGILVDLMRQIISLLTAILGKEYLAKITSGEVANALRYENEKSKNKTGKPLLT